MRSFALSLGFTSSFISKLFNGKRPLTKTTFIKICEKLNLSPLEIKKFSPGINSKTRKTDLETFAFNQICPISS